MGDFILIPLIVGCLVAVVFVVRSYVIWSLSNDPHTKFDENDAFEAWYDDECRIAAAELVGPNSPEYVALIDRMLDDDARKAAARKFYDGMK